MKIKIQKFIQPLKMVAALLIAMYIVRLFGTTPFQTRQMTSFRKASLRAQIAISSIKFSLANFTLPSISLPGSSSVPEFTTTVDETDHFTFPARTSNALPTVTPSFDSFENPPPTPTEALLAEPTIDTGDQSSQSLTQSVSIPTSVPTVQPTTAPAQNINNFSSISFAFGGQSHGTANANRMKEMGMGWIKFQHKWHDGQSGQELAGRIKEGHSKGLKVLLSIPGPYKPSSVNYGSYVNFIRQVAALPEPPDAIEVWNEPNLDLEWPAGQISPETYVNNLLKPSYQAIKAENPKIGVISAALGPTGYFSGCSSAGCDDKPYLDRMVAAGAKNYLDCVGVHYNEGIVSPKNRSGDPRGSHYTRYFYGMVDTYHNAFGKPLCFTELGYLVGAEMNPPPAGFEWARNTTALIQARNHSEVYQIAKSDNRVKMYIIWNVDISNNSSSDPQGGFSIIRPNGSCPICELLR